MKEIEDALEYALMLLKDQANKGKYPELALQENGGKGFQPITDALNRVKNNVDLADVGGALPELCGSCSRRNIENKDVCKCGRKFKRQ